MAQVLVQNRVSLALPVIPPLVQTEGINVKKMSPSTMMIVNLISPDGRYDSTLPEQLRDDLHQGRAGPAARRRRHHLPRPARLQPARLARPGQAGGAQPRAPWTWSPPSASRTCRSPPGRSASSPCPQGPAIPADHQHPGPADRPGAVRRHHPQGRPRATRTVPGLAGLASMRRRPRARPGQSGDSAQTGQRQPDRRAAGHRHRPAPRRRDPDARRTPRVELGSQQYDQSCTLDGQPSVALSIYQLPGSNALETAKGVYAKMEELKTRFPDGLDYRIVYDTTPFIRESVDEVFKTLRDAVILVAIVVLVFLQNWRAALIPLIAVPVAIVGTFAVMAALGFSLNNLSLFGLVLAIGIVVDDAIVVVENVERWLEQGLAPREAARKAMDEVTGPVIAVALVLCAVFVPCAFLGGDHRPVLPPVRRDDRRLDGDLGVQLADAQPGPGGDPAQAARRAGATR